MITIKIINLKLNTTFLAISFSVVFAITFTLIAIFKIIKINDTQTIIMTNENYTSILNDCHNNLSNYVGKKVSMIGYIFRMDDFENTQFVIARDMLVNDSDARIVGFLCTYKKAQEFENNSWVSAEGIITKGNYNGEMPIINIIKMHKTTTPNDVFVHPYR